MNSHNQPCMLLLGTLSRRTLASCPSPRFPLLSKLPQRLSLLRSSTSQLRQLRLPLSSPTSKLCPYVQHTQPCLPRTPRPRSLLSLKRKLLERIGSQPPRLPRSLFRGPTSQVLPTLRQLPPARLRTHHMSSALATSPRPRSIISSRHNQLRTYRSTRLSRLRVLAMLRATCMLSLITPLRPKFSHNLSHRRR